MTILTIGIHTANSVFAVHGVDAAGKVQLRQPKVARAKLNALIASLPPCTIGLDACSGVHFRARQGHVTARNTQLLAQTMTARTEASERYKVQIREINDKLGKKP